MCSARASSTSWAGPPGCPNTASASTWSPGRASPPSRRRRPAMERILIGIDPEAASDVAVEWATERGRRHEVELHAVSVGDLQHRHSTQLEDRLAKLR